MNQLTTFNFNDFEVRTVLIDNDPHFVLADVCKVLEIKNATDVAKRLEDDERTRFNLGRQGEAVVINESGLYSVILRSDKPQAKTFRKWVTSEVLPSIRKTGGYQMPQTPIEAIKLMLEVQEQTQADVNDIKVRVHNIEENALLNPGEYNLINSKVSERIRTVKRERKLEGLSRQQNGELYRAINRDIKAITGVKCRSQLRQKDLDKVLDFIYDWEPSKATLLIINELGV